MVSAYAAFIIPETADTTIQLKNTMLEIITFFLMVTYSLFFWAHSPIYRLTGSSQMLPNTESTQSVAITPRGLSEAFVTVMLPGILGFRVAVLFPQVAIWLPKLFARF